MSLTSSESVGVRLDYTPVNVVVPCNVCGKPVHGQRYAFAKDEDLIGKLAHFGCAAATINQ